MDAKRIPENQYTFLNLERLVKEKFSFLQDIGFAIIISTPTTVRFCKGDVQLDVYYERHQIGVGITFLEVRYELQDFIAAINPDSPEAHYVPCISSPEGTAIAVEKFAELTKIYGTQALQGSFSLFKEVAAQHNLDLKKYWLDLNAMYVRPQAEEAFRMKKYREAVELYKEIEPILSPTEIKKLALAQDRSKKM